MATNKLTDALCKKAIPSEKPRKLADGHGMYLFVSPTGAKVWRVAYKQFGKDGTKILGPYPLLSLADARIKRDEFRRKLLDGEDVKATPQKSITFSDAVAQYWGGRKDVSAGYVQNAVRGLAMHLEPDIGKTPIALVTDAMILVPLLRLDAAEKFVYAKRLRMWSSLVFEWAMARKHCKTNPASLIKPSKAFGKKEEENHPHLPLLEIPEFMQRLAMEKELQSVLACRLMAMTWVRTGELRKFKWDQIDGDVWRVPRENMKKNRIHLVPLSKQSLAILETLRQRSRGGEYVFPGEQSKTRPMSENAVLYLIHRIGFKGRMSGHGWRSVASTWGNEHEYNSDHIEMQLSHSEENEVRGAYNHAQYFPQRRKMMQDFSNWLEQAESSSMKA